LRCPHGPLYRLNCLPATTFTCGLSVVTFTVMIGYTVPRNWLGRLVVLFPVDLVGQPLPQTLPGTFAVARGPRFDYAFTPHCTHTPPRLFPTAPHYSPSHTRGGLTVWTGWTCPLPFTFPLPQYVTDVPRPPRTLFTFPWVGSCTDIPTFPFPYHLVYTRTPFVVEPCRHTFSISRTFPTATRPQPTAPHATYRLGC